MSQDTANEVAEAPKKSKKMLMIIVIAVVVLLGGGAGAFFMLKGDSAEAAPVKGVVTPIDAPLTINLEDGHYLKVGFALQQTADSHEAVDTSEALNIAIEIYTGMSVEELSTEKGREAAKEELLTKIVKAYTVDGVQEVMDIYYTSFVTQ